MRVVLISTYEQGRQPFGLASAAAWLRAAGHEVAVADLARAPMPWPVVQEARLLAFYLPMHTSARLFARLIDRVRAANPSAHLCAYGLYAPFTQGMLRRLGVQSIIGGEFEQALAELAQRLEGGPLQPGVSVSLDRQQFLVPDRAGLPPPGAYARLVLASEVRRAGYTEASRGCIRACRHCPVPPVYRGALRIVQREVVLEDIRRQIAAGAQHITFGDPDFLNGPGHAIPLVEALHAEWPDLTYDVTIATANLVKQRAHLPRLQATGCAFVTTAVESLDDAVLEKLAKSHTRDAFEKALAIARAAALPLAPTFIPFTPWTTLDSYRGFLQAILQLNLAGQVAPIQLATRLVICEGSMLLGLPEVRAMIEPFNPRTLSYHWRNPSPEVDALCRGIQDSIKRAERRGQSRAGIFEHVWALAGLGEFPDTPRPSRATIPYLTEPWYC